MTQTSRNHLAKLILFPFILLLLISCNKKNTADTIIYNATIYTVDSSFSVAQAMVIKNKKIIAIGKKDSLLEAYECKNKIDAQGKFIFPGFIDAHAHFLAYGLQLNTVNLMGTTSWDEVLKKTTNFSKNADSTKWIIGRGWDQNDWSNKNFPTNEKLNALYPNTPVLLARVDGHAAIANDKALALAKVSPNQKVEGGVVETINGKLSGVLVDNAVDLVQNIIQAPSDTEKEQALIKAQENCFAMGLTTIDDCGLDFEEVELIEKLYKNNLLSMKLYIMLSDKAKNFTYLFKRGKIKTVQLTVNSFKVYADGALGSRGACLLQHYSDKPNETGFLLATQQHFDSVANIIYKNNFQMCTHAIGDSGNRVVLNIYAKYLKEKNDLRWRIEHAQVVAPNDFNFFGQYSIIPSVQPTHATSDMYWAEQRLGKERVANAYAYKKLLQQNSWMPLGTDFPVEDISPFKTFFASSVRKDANNFPANGYQMENALTRQETLKGMTIWAAKSNFEELDKGSLEVGKYADFIILDTDLLYCPESKILGTKVISTWINGGRVWGK
jgi:predicted amidohydrolase YtcJ